MERVRRILKKLFFPGPIPTALIAIPSFVFVSYALVSGLENSVFAYIAYVMSAYSLVIVTAGITETVRSIRKGINNYTFIKKILSRPAVNRFMNDALFRAEVSLYQGLLLNLLYAVIKLASGIYYRSQWFGAVAVYYIFLAVMRFFLLKHLNKNTAGRNILSELRRYRLCGVLLLFMNQALTGIVIFIVYRNKGYEYPGVLIYVMAGYTFYAVVTALMNVIKFRKHGSPVMSAAKVIDLTAALVSTLSLETAMLSQFGGLDNMTFRRNMTAATGSAVCIIVLALSVFMIVRATKQIKKMQFNGSEL